MLLSIDIPFSSKNEFVQSYKVSKRKEDDLALVSACFYVKLNQSSGNNEVIDSHFSFGGVNATPVGSVKTRAAILGSTWDSDIAEKLQEMLANEHPIALSVPGGVPCFRRALSRSLALKFVRSVCLQMGVDIDDREVSAVTIEPRPVSSSLQVFEEALVNKQDGIDPVGQAQKHTSALQQVFYYLLLMCS